MAGDDRCDPLSGRRGIRLAFLPWIAYWILWPLELEAAALLSGLALALGLNVYRFARGRPKLMDATTAAFFVVGTVVTLALGSRVFVRSGLLLGHATLAAMAAGSLIGRSPFIGQYVRDEWPPEIVATPLFRATNTAVTWLWTAIFAVSGLLQVPALGVAVEARLFLPPLLVVAGGLLSSPVSRWYVRRGTAPTSRTSPSGSPGAAS